MTQSLEKEKFIDVAADLSDAVLVTDPDGHIKWCNPAFIQLCGYTKREVIGQRPGEFLQGPDTDPETVRTIHNALASREHISTEILNYHKEGYSYWVSINITPVSSKGGRLRGYIAVEREVSESKQRLANVESHVVELYATLLFLEASGTKDDPFDMD